MLCSETCLWRSTHLAFAIEAWTVLSLSSIVHTYLDAA